MIVETQQRIRCSSILATVAALPQEQVLRLVPQEQVLRLVDKAETTRFQFQKTSITDNIQQVAGNYSSGRQSKTKFGWQNGGSLSAQFPTIGPDDKVVLTAIPNVIAASFGTTKPQGDLDSVSVEFANLEQGLDFEPYISIM